MKFLQSMRSAFHAALLFLLLVSLPPCAYSAERLTEPPKYSVRGIIKSLMALSNSNSDNSTENQSTLSGNNSSTHSSTSVNAEPLKSSTELDLQRDLREIKFYYRPSEYNEEQRRRVEFMSRELYKQHGNTCQTNASIGLAFLTGQITSVLKSKVPGKLNDSGKPDTETEAAAEPIYCYYIKQRKLTPNVGSGPIIVAKELVDGIDIRQYGYRFREGQTTETTLREFIGLIDSSIDNGKPVLVGLYAGDLWRNLYECGEIKDSIPWFDPLAHMVIVVGLIRMVDGTVEGYYLRDTGVGMTYFVDRKRFYAAMIPRYSILGLGAGLDGRSIIIGIPVKPAIDNTGKDMVPIRFFSLNGEWEVQSGSDKMSVKIEFAPLPTVKLTHNLTRPGVWKKGDTLGEIYNETGGLANLQVFPYNFHGCRSLGNRYPGRLIEDYGGDGVMSYRWQFDNVPNTYIYPSQRCRSELRGTKMITVRKKTNSESLNNEYRISESCDAYMVHRSIRGGVSRPLGDEELANCLGVNVD